MLTEGKTRGSMCSKKQNSKKRPIKPPPAPQKHTYKKEKKKYDKKILPGRKNIRRINAMDRLEHSLETLKKSKIDTEDVKKIKKFKEEKAAKIEVIETIISNTKAKVLDQNAAVEIKTKIFRTGLLQDIVLHIKTNGVN